MKLEASVFKLNFISGLNHIILDQISRLSGITNEITFPVYKLTLEEENLLKSDYKNFDGKRRHSWYTCDTWRSNSDSQVTAQNENKQPITRTMESLTNEMVSSIMGEVKRLSTEMTTTQSETTLKDSDDNKDSEKYEAKLLQNKLLNIESECLRLAFLQFTALKTLNIILTSSKYADYFLINNSFGNESVIDEEKDHRDTIKNIMRSLVDKSISQCKLKSIISMAEIERAESVLHYNYTKCRTKEGIDKEEIKQKVDRILDMQNLQNKLNAGASTSSCSTTQCVRNSTMSVLRPPSSLTISNGNYPPRSINSDPATPQGNLNFQ